MCEVRDPHADTAPVDSQFLRTVTIHGRVYQKYSVDNVVHFEPVDEVISLIQCPWNLGLNRR